MNKKDITLDSIARKLGISKSAVSLALSGKYGVSEETTRKVLLEAVTLGYKINPGKRKRVAIIMSPHEIRPGSFFFEIFTGIDKELQKNNIIMDIRLLEDENNTSAFLMYLLENKINAAIAFSDVSAKLIEDLRRININIVLIHNRTQHKEDLTQIKANNFMGGYLAAEYLFEAGHRDIVFVGDISYSINFAERYYGFREYLASHDTEGKILTGKADLIFPPIFNRNKVRDFLTDSHRTATAVFCANDAIAVEIYRICEDFSIRIPEDLSIMGFDNTPECESLKPALTSINIPKEEIGIAAVKVLLDIINNQYQGSARTIQINTGLAERESVKRLK